MISSMSEEIIIIALPASASVFMSWYISCFAPTSMPFVGSSKMIISGSAASALARTTFC